MSHAVTIIGIPALQVERVKRSRGIEVWARPYRRPPRKHRHGHDVRIKATHRRTVKHTRQGNQVMTLHLRVPKYHCWVCRRYLRHAFDGILPRYRAFDPKNISGRFIVEFAVEWGSTLSGAPVSYHSAHAFVRTQQGICIRSNATHSGRG